MKYKAEANNFEKALGISKDQEKRLKDAITKAYNQHFNELGANVDQINNFVAPYIKSEEEAFYVSQVILSDVFGAMMDLNKLKN